MIALDLVPLAILGAVLGLDVVSFPQAMISRPLVAATLAGAFLGHAMEGLLAGAALELIALETLPFGASRYPEWGSAAVVGGALFATAGPAMPAGAMSLAVVGALATAWVGGWTMVGLRRLNAMWARRLRVGLESGSRSTVIGLQLFGLTADLIRGGLLTFLAMLLLRPTVQAALGAWRTEPRLSRAVVVAICASVAAGAAWKIFHATHGARWYFLGGLAHGLAVLGLR